MKVGDRIGRRMKLHDLHVLMTVVQVGSMNKSAALLNTTQPAISRSIADLEHALGVRLLDRHQQGVEPTEYGRALLRCGAAVFDELRQGVKSIEFLADPATGEVRVGCSANLTTSFAADVVDRLSRRYPRMVFHLVNEDPEALRRGLHERKFDLLIARQSNVVTDEQLCYESLFDESYMIAAGVRNPWSRRRKIKLAELVSESWLMPLPGTATSSVASALFRASGLDFPRATVFARGDVRMRLLATGRFLSIFSERRFLAKHSEVKVLSVDLPIPSEQIGMITLKGRTLSPGAQLFISSAREIAGSLTK